MKIFKDINFWRYGGLLIVLFTVYWRFLRPRTIGALDLTYSNVKIILYCISILSLSITLLLIILVPLYLKYLIAKSDKKVINGAMTKIRENMVKYLGEIYKKYNKMLYEFFYPLYQKYSDTYVIWMKLIYFGIRCKPYIDKISKIFYFLPPCIISFIYFLEVVKYHYFTYFPLAIFLMIFPISIRVFLYVIKVHCEDFDKGLSTIVKIVRENEDGVKVYDWHKNAPYPEAQTPERLFDTARMKEINLEALELFKSYKERLLFFPFRLYFHIFSLLCWLISLSTLLYLMLYNNLS